MISALSSAVSAIKAFDKKMAVVSNNVANAQTDGYKKSRADLKEGNAGDVKVDISVVDSPGPIIAVEENNSTVQKEMSNVDLVKEFSDLIRAQRGFQASSRIITVADQVLAEITNLKR